MSVYGRVGIVFSVTQLSLLVKTMSVRKAKEINVGTEVVALFPLENNVLLIECS